jgi:hypothetical protein
MKAPITPVVFRNRRNLSVDGQNMQQRRTSVRCRVCRLPGETLAEVHRERYAWGATYEQLAEKLRASDHTTSTSSLRRHFHAHVRNGQIEDSEAEAANLQEIATPFDALVGGSADDRAVADAMVNTLLEQLQRVEKTRRITRDGAQADRFAARSLKQIAALDRALRRRQEIRRPYDELLAKVRDTLHRIPDAAGEAFRTSLEEHAGFIDQAVDEFLRDYSYPDRLLRRINQAKAEFPKMFASRIVRAIQSVTQETLDSLR